MENGRIAFVLSGGGNYGALQAGALEGLLEMGIYPDLLVGTSAGALNAVFLAIEPSLAQAQRLAETWISLKPEEVGVANSLVLLRQMLRRKPSMFDPKYLTAFIRAKLPAGVVSFKDLKVPARTVAVRLKDGLLRVFGDDPQDQLIDGMMSSSAIPPYYPPWPCAGEHYVDGGARSNLPLLVALERGAGEIYALDVQDKLGNTEKNIDMMGLVWRTVSFMLLQQTEMELREARRLGAIVHYIPLQIADVSFWDFRKAERLIAIGKEQTFAALSTESHF